MTRQGSLVIGAGIAGAAAARALHESGASVTVVDRGRRPGGRMSSRTLHDRPVDLGASYFTAATGSAFSSVVDDWIRRGLARAWTDTLTIVRPDGTRESTTGPMRYAAPGGLRSLVVDLVGELPVESNREVRSVDQDGTVDGQRWDSVTMAMPDPQARRLLPDAAPMRDVLQASEEWEPTIAVVLGFEQREWDADLRGAFVHESPAVTFVADDGDRRGDGAPVLVAHTTAELARRHLDAPDGAIDAVLDALRGTLGIRDPAWVRAHRWTFARPRETHPEPFLRDGAFGVAGDSWGGSPSVGAAWASGDALGRALATEILATEIGASDEH